MERVRLVIHDDADSRSRLQLDAPTVTAALLVADINMDGGVAELWREGRLLARMRKRHGLHHPLWEMA